MVYQQIVLNIPLEVFMMGKSGYTLIRYVINKFTILQSELPLLT